MKHAQFVPNSSRFTFAPRLGPPGATAEGSDVALYAIGLLGFGQLSVGDEWESPARTITEADVVHFAALTGDFNPIHVDHESARKTPFGRPIAHGLLVLSYAAGLTSAAPRVDTIAFLGIKEWIFHLPVFFGDTIRVRSRVEALEPRAKGRRGVVTWHRRIVNQSGEIVQEGRTQTLVHARPSRGGPAAAGSGD
jgi:acyl dehydratase